MPAARLTRYLQAQVQADLARKMVFVGGPRQVGKTSLGQAIVTDPRAWLNFDIPAHRAAIRWFTRRLLRQSLDPYSPS